MNLDSFLARVGVDRAEAQRWFSSCTLALNTLYVADIDDFGTITRCYTERLRAVLPGLSIVFRPAASATSEKPKVPSYIKKSAEKDYIAHHDLYGRK